MSNVIAPSCAYAIMHIPDNEENEERLIMKGMKSE